MFAVAIENAIRRRAVTSSPGSGVRPWPDASAPAQAADAQGSRKPGRPRLPRDHYGARAGHGARAGLAARCPGRPDRDVPADLRAASRRDHVARELDTARDTPT